MDKVIQMITNGQLTIAVIVSAVAFFLKLLLSSEIDKIFYSRTRQLMTKIIKWIAAVIYLCLIYFALAVNALGFEAWSEVCLKIMNIVCCIVIVITIIFFALIYLLSDMSERVRNAIKSDKVFTIINVVSAIAVVALVISVGIEDWMIFSMVPADVELSKEVLKNICIIVISLSVVPTLALYFYSSWLKNICRKVIYVESKNGRILYPMYEAEKGILMCKVETAAKEQLYMRVPKSKLINKMIHMKYVDDKTTQCDERHAEKDKQ